MTVSSSLNRKAYAGDGTTTSFSTSPVVFYDSDELDVYVVTTATGASTTLTENTHYTVSGGAGSTGSVSLAGGSSPYGAPSASQTLVIVRTLDLVQEFDPQNNDGSDADNIEMAFDKLTMMTQQNAASVARAFKLADSDVSGASTEVPTPSASKLIGWNSAGTALENKAAADVDLTTVTAFIQTLLDDADAATARATLGAAASGANTDITSLAAPALGAATATTASAGDNTTKVATTAFVNTAVASPPLPRSYLAGCTLSNNGVDATNDIDIAAGACRDSTNAANITVAAMTKRLDANWAAGTNQGMRYSGAAIADTTYGIWAVSKADGTQDIYAYPNSTAPSAATVLAALQAEVGGASYLYLRRIGAIRRVAGAIVAFTQAGDAVWLKTPSNDINATNPGTAAVTRTLSVPLGVAVDALLAVGVERGAAIDNSVYLSALTGTDQAADENTSMFTVSVSTSTVAWATGGQSLVRTDTSAAIRSRMQGSAADTVLRITTLGWIDRRGRDD